MLCFLENAGSKLFSTMGRLGSGVCGNFWGSAMGVPYQGTHGDHLPAELRRFTGHQDG